jgi:hypothetical protein
MAFHEIIGLIGVTLMLVAYVALMLEVTSSHATRFHAANLAGSLMVIYSLLHDWNLPTFVIEVTWSSIAAYCLLHSIQRRLLSRH